MQRQIQSSTHNQSGTHNIEDLKILLTFVKNASKYKTTDHSRFVLSMQEITNQFTMHKEKLAAATEQSTLIDSHIDSVSRRLLDSFIDKKILNVEKDSDDYNNLKDILFEKLNKAKDDYIIEQQNKLKDSSDSSYKNILSTLQSSSSSSEYSNIPLCSPLSPNFSSTSEENKSSPLTSKQISSCSEETFNSSPTKSNFDEDLLKIASLSLSQSDNTKSKPIPITQPKPPYYQRDFKTGEEFKINLLQSEFTPPQTNEEVVLRITEPSKKDYTRIFPSIHSLKTAVCQKEFSPVESTLHVSITKQRRC